MQNDALAALRAGWPAARRPRRAGVGAAPREQDAEDVIAFADGIAAETMDETGRALPDAEDRAAPIPPARKAPLGFSLARKAFRAAARRLKQRAESEADRKAQAKLAAETTEIRKADDILVEIARLLPEQLRRKVATARRSLTARIMVLDRNAKPGKPAPDQRREPPEWR